MTHTELIEQIRQGTPLENDIDVVELLRVVLKEVFPKDTVEGVEGIYNGYCRSELDRNCWSPIVKVPPNAIKLSAFKTKMVSVEDVKDFFFYKANLEDNNWVRFKHQDITTFLNEKGV